MSYYIFRPLTSKEITLLLQFANKLSDIALEDWIISRTYVVGHNSLDYLLNKISYGYTTSLAQKIMILSNIKEESDFTEKLSKSRESSNNLQSSIELFITKIFPSLTLDYIGNLSQVKQLELVALAEIISGERLEPKPIPKSRRGALREVMEEGRVTIGGDIADIVAPGAGDKPDF